MQQIKNHATVSSHSQAHAKKSVNSRNSFLAHIRIRKSSHQHFIALPLQHFNRLKRTARLVVMCSGLNGCALAPLVARGLCRLLSACFCLVWCLVVLVVARWLFVAFFVRVVCVVRVCVLLFALRLAISRDLRHFFVSFSLLVYSRQGKKKKAVKTALNRLLCFRPVRCVASSEKTKEKRQAVEPAVVVNLQLSVIFSDKVQKI